MAKNFVRPFHVIAVLAVLLAQIGITPAVAADRTFEVDSIFDERDANLDDGLCATEFEECTLRAAFEEAVAEGGSTIIELQPEAIYTLSLFDTEFTDTGLVVFSADITVNGHGATIERFDDPDSPGMRIFQVLGVEDTLTLNDLTVRNGLATHDTGSA